MFIYRFIVKHIYNTPHIYIHTSTIHLFAPPSISFTQVASSWAMSSRILFFPSLKRMILRQPRWRTLGNVFGRIRVNTFWICSSINECTSSSFPHLHQYMLHSAISPFRPARPIALTNRTFFPSWSATSIWHVTNCRWLGWGVFMVRLFSISWQENFSLMNLLSWCIRKACWSFPRRFVILQTPAKRSFSLLACATRQSICLSLKVRGLNWESYSLHWILKFGFDINVFSIFVLYIQILRVLCWESVICIISVHLLSCYFIFLFCFFRTLCSDMWSMQRRHRQRRAFKLIWILY